MPKVIKRGSGGPIDPPRRPPQPPKRKQIIEREVVGATKEARRIVAEAEAEALRIVEEAKHEAQETHQRGFEEGREAGLAQYTQEIAGALMKIQKMEQQLEGEYIGLLIECVEKVIGGELRINPEAIVGVVCTALRDARQQREIIVRVHPEDAEVLRKHQNKLLQVLARANSVDVREDPTCRRGGCVIVTELGTIDASLDRQLEALGNAIQTEFNEGGGNFIEEDELDPEDDPGGGGY